MRINLKVVTIMEQNQTSWENFFRNDSSNMLEDALPYLPPNLKKMAAIYIKLTELSRISTQFDNEQTLSACGFDQNPASMELLLNAMKLRAPKETAKQIEQILQMMQMFEIYQNYQPLEQILPDLMAAASRLSEQGLSFTNEEISMIMDGLKETMSPEEQQRIDMIRPLIM